VEYISSVVINVPLLWQMLIMGEAVGLWELEFMGNF
jgi:hypothetical protein